MLGIEDSASWRLSRMRRDYTSRSNGEVCRTSPQKIATALIELGMVDRSTLNLEARTARTARTVFGVSLDITYIYIYILKDHCRWLTSVKMVDSLYLFK